MFTALVAAHSVNISQIISAIRCQRTVAILPDVVTRFEERLVFFAPERRRVFESSPFRVGCARLLRLNYDGQFGMDDARIITEAAHA